MARKKSKARPLYVVVRLGWDIWPASNRSICSHDEEDQGVPVRAFQSLTAARADLESLERDARGELNPFQFDYGELESLTSRPREAFHEAIERLGLEVPTAKRYPYPNSTVKAIDYQAWYEAVRESLTDEQRDGIWALLDKLKLYEIVTTELE